MKLVPSLTQVVISGWHAVTLRSNGSACLGAILHADPRLRRVTACHPAREERPCS
jgi:hypothetical protein